MQLRGFLVIVASLVSEPLFAQKKSEAPTTPEAPTKPTQEITTVIGEANGIGARYWLNLNMAIDVRAEFSLFPESAVLLNANYHLSFAELHRKEGRPAPVYVGGGVKLGGTIIDPSFVFGFSAPIGVGLPLGESPVTAFIELAPGVLFIDGEATIDLDACLGIRYSLPEKKKTPPAR